MTSHYFGVGPTMAPPADKRYQLALPNGTQLQANDLPTLVDALIPGYTDIPHHFPPDEVPEKSLEARIMLAEDYVTVLRDVYLVDEAKRLGVHSDTMDTLELAAAIATAAEDLDPSERDQYRDDLTTMMSTHAGLPVLVGATWTHSMPILAVSTAYLSDDKGVLAFPTGHVFLIDPRTDSTFLASLQQVGLVQFGELTPSRSARIEDDSPGWEHEPM